MRKRDSQGISIKTKLMKVDSNHHPTKQLNFHKEKENIIVLAYQPGIGKTHNALKYMERNPDTFYFTDRHQVIDDNTEDWKKRNIKHAHWKGFNRICKDPIRKKISPSIACNRCPKKNGCNYRGMYFNQFKKDKRVFAPFEYLNNREFKDKIDNVKVVILDEKIGKVKRYSIDNKKLIEWLDTIGITNDQIYGFLTNYIQNDDYANFFYTKNYGKTLWNFYTNALSNELKKSSPDEDEIKKIKEYTPSQIIEYGDWYLFYLTKEESFGVPFYYYAFQALNENSDLKLVILDASFDKDLFRYFLESFNGEKGGFKHPVSVKIYTTDVQNKNTIIYRMRPNGWHPKVSFSKYADTTNKWMFNHIRTIKNIFGENNVGIVSFKTNVERWRLLGIKNVESFGNLRSSNALKDKKVLIIIGSYIPRMIQTDDNGQIIKDGLIQLIYDYFMREPYNGNKGDYGIDELGELIDKEISSKSKRDYYKEKVFGMSHNFPKRYVDSINPSVKLQYADYLLPVETIIGLWDDEIYQALHRNRGLQHDRIIFAYCWIPKSKIELHPYKGPLSDILDHYQDKSQIRKEFTIETIKNKDEKNLFDDLRNQYGDIGLTKELIEDINDGLSNTKIAKKYKIFKSGKGLDVNHVKDIRSKYNEFKTLMNKAKRRK